MPKGTITLLVRLETYPRQTFFMVDFLVVKTPSSYNFIIGWLTLKMAQAMVSLYHLKLKFPTKHGVEEMKGD